jgi:hypothetical protein
MQTGFPKRQWVVRALEQRVSNGANSTENQVSEHERNLARPTVTKANRHTVALRNCKTGISPAEREGGITFARFRSGIHLHACTIPTAEPLNDLCLLRRGRHTGQFPGFLHGTLRYTTAAMPVEISGGPTADSTAG